MKKKKMVIVFLLLAAIGSAGAAFYITRYNGQPESKVQTYGAVSQKPEQIRQTEQERKVMEQVQELLQKKDTDGITSYVCGQPGQMMVETYETLKLAFETQQPKLVLFETNVLFRKQKAEEKKDLMSKLYVREDSKGFKLRDGIKPYQKGAYMKKTEKKEKMTEQVKMYMEKIVKLCREQGAGLVLISTPSPKNYNYRKHNTLQEYAEKKSLVYLDMNLITDRLQIDWKTDTMDQGDHLNLSGARKVTKYLGKYLKKEFKLWDHRDEASYKSWERTAKEYIKKEQEMLKQIQIMRVKTEG